MVFLAAGGTAAPVYDRAHPPVRPVRAVAVDALPAAVLLCADAGAYRLPGGDAPGRCAPAGGAAVLPAGRRGHCGGVGAVFLVYRDVLPLCPGLWVAGLPDYPAGVALPVRQSAAAGGGGGKGAGKPDDAINVTFSFYVYQNVKMI